MVGAAGLFGEPEVPGDRAPLTLGADAAVAVGAGIRAVVDIAAVQEAVVFAVRGKDLTEAAALHHGLAHEAFRLHAAAVVGKRDDAWREPVKIREPLPFFAYRDGAVGMDVDERVFFDDRALHGQRGSAVRHGVEIRHGRDVGEAAVGRGKRAGPDRLFIRKSRFTKMYMHINKTGK